MREDATDLLVSGARSGAIRRSRKKVDFENAPSMESMRHKTTSFSPATKEFRDVTNPLQRFLEGACGRPWNDVYSELCAVIKGGGFGARHFHEHIVSSVRNFKSHYDESGRFFFRRYGLYIDNNGILMAMPNGLMPTKIYYDVTTGYETVRRSRYDFTLRKLVNYDVQEPIIMRTPVRDYKSKRAAKRDRKKLRKKYKGKDLRLSYSNG